MSLTIEEHIPLAPLTTIRLGGPARFFTTATTATDIIEALTWAHKEKVPLHVLAGGSNTIFADSGFEGLVLKLNVRGSTIGNEGNVTAAAGENWDDLVRQTIDRNLAGLENMSGIPGSVGATPVQNVGAYGQEVSQTMTRVTAIDRTTHETVTFTNEQCHFAYRTSRFKEADRDRYIITEVRYKLTPRGEPTLTYPQLAEALQDGQAVTDRTPQQQLQRVREAVLKLRRRKSMVIDEADPNSRSCGSFFVNPAVSSTERNDLQEKWHARGGSGDIPTFIDSDDGTARIPAAWLIEQAGFKKGERRGRVGISTNHPLALVNFDNGTTHELLTLKEEVQGAVKEKFGITLIPEPNIIK